MALVFWFCSVWCVSLLCTAILTTPLSLIPFQCTNSPWFFFHTKALGMQWKIKYIFFCINKPLLLSVQEFVDRWVTLACIRTGFTNAGLSLAGQGDTSELTPKCSWGNTTRTPWEKPLLLQKQLCHLGFVRSILFCIKEKKWCLCFLDPCICLLLPASSLATWWQLLSSVVLLPICTALVSTFRIQQNTNIKQQYNLL